MKNFAIYEVSVYFRDEIKFLSELSQPNSYRTSPPLLLFLRDVKQ